jgi:succinoglycan biosynthesis transport protein ExoP
MFSSDMWAALRARWKLILGVFALTIALAMLWISTVERSYVARASLLFDEKGPSPALQESSASQDDRSLLGTQADIIKSDAVARRVIVSEKLLADRNLAEAWAKGGHKAGSFQRWLTTDLLANLDVLPERDTNVLAVRFRASNPDFAARIANSFAANFVSMRMQISTDTAKQYASWFQQRTNEVRAKLEQAQSRVTDFQRSHGIVDGSVLALEADRLSALSGQLAQAEGGAADLRARAGTRVTESPDVQSTAVIQSLRQQAAASEAKIGQLGSNYGPNHPEMLAAQAELAVLRAKLGSETSAASRSVKVASSAASSRESQLQDLVSQQRARMLALSGNQSEVEALQNDVATAQKAYDAVTQRLNLMRLQSGLPTTNAQQVDRATPPLLPASPNVPLLMFIAAIAGLVLGILAAVILEVRRPLVRTSAGLTEAVDASVIGRFDFAASRPGRILAGGM